MGWAQDFQNILKDPYGEAMSARLYLRADTSGGSNQLISIAANDVVAVSDITRRRERSFGVVQPQQWEVQISNVDDYFNPNSSAWPTTEDTLMLHWGALEIGFPDNAEWELVAQGRLRRMHASTDGTAILEFADPLFDLLNFEWPREAVFDDRDAWVSPVRVASKAATSSSFLHQQGPVVIAADPTADIVNETFKIVFATSTTYNIVYEDGTTQSGGPFSIATATVDVVSNATSQAVVRIYTADWDAAGGAYTADDTFEFYTSPQYASATLAPIDLIQELISQAGITNSYDVVSGFSQSLYYDTAQWGAVKTDFASSKARGYFAKKSNLMDMIQGLLRACNATIYPSVDGRIAIWHLWPDDIGTTTWQIRGDPDDDRVAILEAERIHDDAGIVNRTAWTYGDLNFTSGDDGNVPTIQRPTITKDDLDATTYTDPIGVTPVRDSPVEINWCIDGVTVDASSNRYLARFKDDNPQYLLRGALRLLLPDVADPIALTEPFLAESLTTLQVTQVGVRVFEQEAELLAIFDPIVNEDYARVGTATVDGSDPIF